MFLADIEAVSVLCCRAGHCRFETELRYCLGVDEKVTCDMYLDYDVCEEHFGCRFDEASNACRQLLHPPSEGKHDEL